MTPFEKVVEEALAKLPCLISMSPCGPDPCRCETCAIAVALRSALDETRTTKRDACQMCLGAKGGEPGNENIIGGKVLCDYCTSLWMEIRDAAARTATAKPPEAPRSLHTFGGTVTPDEYARMHPKPPTDCQHDWRETMEYTETCDRCLTVRIRRAKPPEAGQHCRRCMTTPTLINAPPCPGIAPAPAGDVADLRLWCPNCERVFTPLLMTKQRNCPSYVADAWSRAHPSPPEKGPRTQMNVCNVCGAIACEHRPPVKSLDEALPEKGPSWNSSTTATNTAAEKRIAEEKGPSREALMALYEAESLLAVCITDESVEAQQRVVRAALARCDREGKETERG